MTPRAERDRQSAPPLLIAALLILAVSLASTSAWAYGGPGWSGHSASERMLARAASHHHACASSQRSTRPIRVVIFRIGWAVYTGRRPGVLVAACPETGSTASAAKSASAH